MPVMNISNAIRIRCMVGNLAGVCSCHEHLPYLGEETHLGQALPESIPDPELQRCGILDIKRIALLPLEVLLPGDDQVPIGIRSGGSGGDGNVRKGIKVRLEVSQHRSCCHV